MNFCMNRLGETWEKVGGKPGDECLSNVGESASAGKDFRVNFKEAFMAFRVTYEDGNRPDCLFPYQNFRVMFNVTGKQLDRMTDMILRLSSGRLLVVKELAEEYGVSVRTIHEDIRRLEGWNIVTFEGPPKKGRYVLTDKGKALLEGMK